MMRKAHLLFVMTLAFNLWPKPAHATPAFARKYGVRCTVCHEAWPVLNDFGRQFRDNGYRMNLGEDDPPMTDPAYWPIYALASPQYRFDLLKSHDNKDLALLRSGQFQQGTFVLGAIGTVGAHASYLVIPLAVVNGQTVGFPAGWIRFNDIANTPWLNVKLGQNEPDLPFSRIRDLDMTSNSLVAYSYHTPGSVSQFDMANDEMGIEIMGHNRGSGTRYSVNAFNVGGSPAQNTKFNTPGTYGHVTHEFQFRNGPLTALEVGSFASYATWPRNLTQTPPGGLGTDNLKASEKYGGEVHAWFGQFALPIHANFTFIQGRDDKALVPGGVRDGLFNGGFAQVIANPKLPLIVFGRFDFVRNRDQSLPNASRDFHDQTGYTIGAKHTFEFTTRAEYALFVNYSWLRVKQGASDLTDTTRQVLSAGIHFAF
jgi:hypothetical protein